MKVRTTEKSMKVRKRLITLDTFIHCMKVRIKEKSF